jgi:hypothetical protein
MNTTTQERRPANLAALRQGLMELAANTKSSATKEKPIIVQWPVAVVAVPKGPPGR